MFRHITKETDRGGEVPVFFEEVPLPVCERLVPFEFLCVKNEAVYLITWRVLEMSPSVIDGLRGSSVHVVALPGKALVVAVGHIEVYRLAQVHVVDRGLGEFFGLFPGAHARISARLRGFVIEYRVVLGAGVGVVVGSGSGVGAHRLRCVDFN